MHVSAGSNAFHRAMQNYQQKRRPISSLVAWSRCPVVPRVLAGAAATLQGLSSTMHQQQQHLIPRTFKSCPHSPHGGLFVASVVAGSTRGTGQIIRASARDGIGASQLAPQSSGDSRYHSICSSPIAHMYQASPSSLTR